MQNTGAKPLKILFVDNSRTTRTAMSMILAREGYEVIPIATGQEAIEKLQAESFDVVVTDLYALYERPRSSQADSCTS